MVQKNNPWKIKNCKHAIISPPFFKRGGWAQLGNALNTQIEKQQSLNFSLSVIEGRLDRIIIELHDLGREMGRLKFIPLEVADTFRQLGDSTSNLKSMIREIEDSNKVCVKMSGPLL